VYNGYVKFLKWRFANEEALEGQFVICDVREISYFLNAVHSNHVGASFGITGGAASHLIKT